MPEIHEIASVVNSGLLAVMVPFLIKFLLTDHVHRSEFEALCLRVDRLFERLIEHEKGER